METNSTWIKSTKSALVRHAIKVNAKKAIDSSREKDRLIRFISDQTGRSDRNYLEDFLAWNRQRKNVWGLCDATVDDLMEFIKTHPNIIEKDLSVKAAQADAGKEQ